MYTCFPTIECKDGFSFSVQASARHWCSPRSNSGPYKNVEVGYPSEQEDLLKEYQECNNDSRDAVYPFVPIGVVQSIVEKHGGTNVIGRITLKTLCEGGEKEEIKSLLHYLAHTE